MTKNLTNSQKNIQIFENMRSATASFFTIRRNIKYMNIVC